MLHFDKAEFDNGGFRLSADWQVPAGTKLALIGPSGAGKSTLLAGLAGFVPCIQGAVRCDGVDLAGLAPGTRPLTMLFQDHNLFPHLTVAQNVGLGLAPNLHLDAAQHAAVNKVLGRVGLEALGDRKPSALSGGQASRVALARALLRARPLLLLDEPFAALGPGLKAEMLDLVSELLQGTETTLIMVTHDPRDAQKLADQTVFVDQAVAQLPQETGAFFANPSDALARYIGA